MVEGTEYKMTMRSLLFVPGDSPRKLSKALESGADALLLDLEDSVAPAAKVHARACVKEFLETRQHPAKPTVFVRINPLDSRLAQADLEAVIGCNPAGVMLPKCGSGRDVQHLSALLAVLEAEHGLAAGIVQILPIVTETAASLFQLGSYSGASARMAGLAWGAEDLSADIGAESSRDAAGILAGPYALARSLTLLGAAAAQVPAIDAVFVDFRDAGGLERECEAARRDGFAGKMAIHPDQVRAINAAFTPSADALAQAELVVAAFAAAPEAGVVAIGGAMFDRPHLLRAQRVLRRGGQSRSV